MIFNWSRHFKTTKDTSDMYSQNDHDKSMDFNNLFIR